MIREAMDGNRRDRSPDQLHRIGWPLAEPVLRAGETTTAAIYRQLPGTGRTCTDATAVGTVAEQGRLETHGGTLYTVTRDRMPDTAPMVAVLRY